MAQKTKAQLTAELEANITDALNNQNTAARVREIIQDIIDSYPNIYDDRVTRKSKTISLNLNTAVAQEILLGDGISLVHIEDIILFNASRPITTAQNLQFVNTGIGSEVIFVSSHVGPFINPYPEFESLALLQDAINKISFAEISQYVKVIQTVNGLQIEQSNVVANPFTALLGTVEGLPTTVDCVIIYTELQ